MAPVVDSVVKKPQEINGPGIYIYILVQMSGSSMGSDGNFSGTSH